MEPTGGDYAGENYLKYLKYENKEAGVFNFNSAQSIAVNIVLFILGSAVIVFVGRWLLSLLGL